MRKLVLIISFCCPSFLVAQNSIGVLCNDFKINGEIKSIGREFRKSFESILSNLDHPPTVIERENLSDLITKIEEERNLVEVDLASIAIRYAEVAELGMNVLLTVAVGEERPNQI